MDGRGSILAGALSLGISSLGMLLPIAAGAQTFEPIKPMDTAGVDKAMLDDVFGRYEIRDATGKKKCRIILKRDYMIGGMQIEVAKDCAAQFPVMGEITAWRLMESWTIDLVDALRKTRVRFQTPDERYVAIPEVDGMDELFKLPAR
ncbi:AprI/Inh family metalloprotease inhibitor [Aquabacter sp. CN5-332]|uniref:AprI/Inh family metalloprotease inhibitor n=1 Tax=Aquabacter sp. CN5-332 TaxID=3156608 RepID=UPI0032B40796